jgi:hypothetical protein
MPRGETPFFLPLTWHSPPPLALPLLAAAAKAIQEKEKQVEKLEITKEALRKFLLSASSSSLNPAIMNKIASASAKLDTCMAELQARKAEESALKANCPELTAYLRAKGEESGFRDSIGLTRELARMAPLKKQSGALAGLSGRQFELAAIRAVTDLLLPLLRARLLPDAPQERQDGQQQQQQQQETENLDKERERETPREQGQKEGKGRRGRELVMISNVTMGTPFEIDQLILLTGEHAGEAVEVVGLVEVKRNINDIAKSFGQIQNILNWCCGLTGRYDPAEYRTKSNPSGVFERPIFHEEEGVQHMFTRDSFRRFRVDPEEDRFVDGIYFITRPRHMRGFNSGEESKLASRMSTDPSLGPIVDEVSEAQAMVLQEFLRKVTDPFQAEDVLRLFLKKEHWAQQFIFAIPFDLHDKEWTLADLSSEIVRSHLPAAVAPSASASSPSSAGLPSLVAGFAYDFE